MDMRIKGEFIMFEMDAIEQSDLAKETLEKYKIYVEWIYLYDYDGSDDRERTFDDIKIEVPAGYKRFNRMFDIDFSYDSYGQVLVSISYPNDISIIKDCYVDLSFIQKEYAFEFQMVKRVLEQMKAEQ